VQHQWGADRSLQLDYLDVIQGIHDTRASLTMRMHKQSRNLG
jgi:hypothetical protein